MSNKWMNRLAFTSVALLLAACGGQQEAPAPGAAPQAPAPAPTEQAPATEAAAAEYQVVAVADGGTISGKVSMTGKAPDPEVIEVTKDGTVCGTEKLKENFKVGAGGELADAVVWIDGIRAGKDWDAGGSSVDQKDCHYVPHVQAMPVGRQLEIVNSDAVLHNVHAYAGGETLFNIAQPTQGQRTPKKLKQVGPVELRCDVHSWMQAWIFVAPNPYYAVSAKDGTFSIGGVPAGKHTVKAWHEGMGEKSMEVEVAPAGTATADFAFAQP